MFKAINGSDELKAVFNQGKGALGLITMVRKICGTPGLLMPAARVSIGKQYADSG